MTIVVTARQIKEIGNFAANKCDNNHQRDFLVEMASGFFRLPQRLSAQLSVCLTACLGVRGAITLFAVAGLSITTAAQALTYHPRMDKAIWIAESSVLQCRLTQPIPAFGQAVFDHTAGKPLRFYLQSVSNPMAAGKASLKSSPPVWKSDLDLLDLGLVNVHSGEFPVELEAALANRLLAELYQGKSPGFVRRAWYMGDNAASVDKEAIKVAMSSVNFHEAYSLYRQCLGRLMPVGFDQLERSKVRFDTDKWELKDEAISWLNTIARFVLADPQVDRVFIDGHTDNIHTTTYNVELSRKRAGAVVDYLVSRGLSANQVTTRYHGERYPLTSNNTAQGRSENRRVTIRLERLPPRLSQR